MRGEGRREERGLRSEGVGGSLRREGGVKRRREGGIKRRRGVETNSTLSSHLPC